MPFLGFFPSVHLFCLIKICFLLYALDVSLLSMERQKGVDRDRRGVEVELGGVEGGEIIIITYCTKIVFSRKNKDENRRKTAVMYNMEMNLDSSSSLEFGDIIGSIKNFFPATEQKHQKVLGTVICDLASCYLPPHFTQLPRKLQ